MFLDGEVATPHKLTLTMVDLDVTIVVVLLDVVLKEEKCH